MSHGFRDRLLPIELLAMVQTTNTPLVAAVSGVQILLAVLVLLLLSRTVGLEKMSGE
jgi:putative spermidine/putrescine transport system permease protein